ncbi:MAG TPA: prolipoprotein diacylglyceryl transferase [Rhodospirillaceae bacterium]|nr:prolipoprotein diacylglyceryl transferase [Alphaproteobacteria bacterium]HBH26095.1 prolipoprotein diacylglyceryl transferase [Rhodospirillaceae bacterium]
MQGLALRSQPVALTFPEIDPVAVQIGPLLVRWYALAYIAGIAAGWALARRLAGRFGLQAGAVDDLVAWVMLGIIAGGRLGYVLFYNPLYYIEHPLEVLALWEGGMSFHGGLVGVGVALALFSRTRGVALLPLADMVACVAPIGLLFGRVANFVNGELYGRVTDVPWGVVFPDGGPLPRHPSQLYEAALEGPVLLGLLLILQRWRPAAGVLSGAFLIGYGTARIFVEFFREPDAHIGFLVAGTSMGQWLSAPMLAAGAALIVYARRRAS